MVTRFEQFVSSISALYKYTQKIARSEMIAYGLKGSFAQYLLAIGHHPEGLTASALCEVCDKDKAAISRVIAEMEQKGLIYRESTGVSHYRAKLKLTEKGREAADHVHERAKLAVEAAGKGLSEEDRQNFYSSLHILAENLHTISKKGIPEE